VWGLSEAEFWQYNGPETACDAAVASGRTMVQLVTRVVVPALSGCMRPCGRWPAQVRCTECAKTPQALTIMRRVHCTSRRSAARRSLAQDGATVYPQNASMY
jgi:hypothetical protein